MFEKRIHSFMENIMRRGIALLMCTALILGVFGGLDLKFNLNLITPETVETEAATFAGKKMTNTYLLSVVTGSTAANGKIMFIAIDYYCKDGNQNRKCTEYIFPTEDSLYQSYYTALSVSQTDNTRPSPDKLASKASNSTGVTIKDIKQYYGNSLAANSCNDFLFTPLFPIEKIERVRVFATGSGAWALASFKLYKVDVLYGLCMYGYISSDYYIDFSGSVLASYTANDTYANVTDSNSDSKSSSGAHAGVMTWAVDHIFFFEPSTNTENANRTAEYPLEVYDESYFGTSGASSSSDDYMITDYNRHTQAQYYFKIDIADVFMAGFEEFATSDIKKFKDLSSKNGNISEKLLLTLQYQDYFGYYRVLQIPAITCAYLWQYFNSSEEVRETIVEGFAQQNDTLLFPLNLPDCQTVVECYLTYSDTDKMDQSKWTSSLFNQVAYNDTERKLCIESIQIYKVDNPADFVPEIKVTKYTDTIVTEEEVVADNAASTTSRTISASASYGYSDYSEAVSIPDSGNETETQQASNTSNTSDNSDISEVLSFASNWEETADKISDKISDGVKSVDELSVDELSADELSAAGPAKPNPVPKPIAAPMLTAAPATDTSDNPDKKTEKRLVTTTKEVTCAQIEVNVKINNNLQPYMFATAPDYAGMEFHFGNMTPIDLKKWVSSEDRNQSVNYEMVLERNRVYTGDYHKTYLVKISTDIYSGASTVDNAYMKIHYQNQITSDAVSNEIDIKEEVNALYGYWPGKENGNNFELSYIQGTSAGNDFYFLTTLDNVKAILGITIYFKDDVKDDWQINNVEIYRLTDMSDRYISKTASETTYQSKYKTNYNITRLFTVDEDPEFTTAGKIIYLGTLEGEKSKTVMTTSDEVVENQENIDWDRLRFSMSIEDARQGLNYAYSRASYTVNVNVNKSLYVDSNDDSGSTNNFYFQLVFEGGSSAYVLANQQLTGDGFRPGSQSFKIRTNQNYGELVAVNIIPDDVISDKNDPNDKINIDSIEVSKDSAGGMNTCWVVENIGWVEPNYVDEGAKQTGTGVSGRSASEMARNYLVSYKKNSVNLQCTISLGDFPSGNTDNEGNVTQTVNYFDGTLTAKIQYYDTQGVLQETQFDIVRNIYDYGGKQPKYDANEKLYGGNAVSDPEIMLQPNSIDRFIITMQNVSQLYSISVYAMSPTTAVTLPLKSIAVQTITKESQGMSYGPDGKLIKDNGAVSLCETTNESILEIFCPLGTRQERTLRFTEHSIELDETMNTWSSVISREPTSQNDVINMYVYMDNNMPSKAGDYNLDATIQYITTYGVTKSLKATNIKADKAQNMYYINEQNTPTLSKVINVSLKASDKKTVSARVDHIVIQQIRSGVVIATFYCEFSELLGSVGGETGTSITPLDSNLTIDNEKQDIIIQFSQTSEKTTLVPEGRDVAVAIRYKTKGDTKNTNVYSSRYVFLTDLGISELTPGQIVNVSFSELNVDEIVGIKVKGTGAINAAVDNVIVKRSIKDETGAYKLNQYFNIDANTTLKRSEIYLDVDSNYEGINKSYTMVPVDITFKTAPSQDLYESGTSEPIKAVITYDVMNSGNSGSNTSSSSSLAGTSTAAIEIFDLQNCISEGSTVTNGSATVKLLVPGLYKLRSIKLSNGSSYELFGWSIESVTASNYPGGDDTKLKQTYNRTVNQRVTAKNDVNVVLADINVSAVVNSNTKSDTGDWVSSDTKELINESVNYILKPGETITGTNLNLQGSVGEYGLTHNVYTITASGELAATVNDTISFNYDIVNHEGSFTFTAPSNDTSTVATYRIVIASQEDPGKAININVDVQGTKQYTPESTQPSGDNPISGGSDVISVNAIAFIANDANSTFNDANSWKSVQNSEETLEMQSGQVLILDNINVTGSQGGFYVRAYGTDVLGNTSDATMYVSTTMNGISTGRAVFAPSAVEAGSFEIYQVYIYSTDNSEIKSVINLVVYGGEAAIDDNAPETNGNDNTDNTNPADSDDTNGANGSDGSGDANGADGNGGSDDTNGTDGPDNT